MSDTEIGKYVRDNMPVLSELIKDNNKPEPFTILSVISEILGIDKLEIMGIKKNESLVDARIIFTVIVLLIYDPERLAKTKKSSIISIIACLLCRDADTICNYIIAHRTLIDCNIHYKAKFKNISEILLTGDEK